MNTKKTASVAIAFVLVLMLLVMSLLGACATKEEAGTPLTHISLLTWPMGGGAYVVGYAVSDIINKNSPWLRATAIETEGTDANAKLIATVEYRTSAIAHCTPVPVFKTKRGVEPFSKADLRDLTPTGLASIAEAAVATDLDTVPTKIALLVSEASSLGLSRMYQILREDKGGHRATRLFTDRGESLRWLDLPSDWAPAGS